MSNHLKMTLYAFKEFFHQMFPDFLLFLQFKIWHGDSKIGNEEGNR